MIRFASHAAAALVVAASAALLLVPAVGPGTAQAHVAGSSPAQLYPSWTRVNANCSGRGRKIRCRLKGKVSVVNDGNTPSSPTTLELWISRDDVLDAKGDTKVQTLDVPAVQSNQQVDLSFSFSAPRGTKVLKRHLIAVVDPDNLVTESDETDNEEAIGPLR